MWWKDGAELNRNSQKLMNDDGLRKAATIRSHVEGISHGGADDSHLNRQPLCLHAALK